MFYVNYVPKYIGNLSIDCTVFIFTKFVELFNFCEEYEVCCHRIFLALKFFSSCFKKVSRPSLALFGSVSAHHSNISPGPRGPPPRGRRDWNQNYMEHLENNPDKKIAKRKRKSTNLRLLPKSYFEIFLMLTLLDCQNQSVWQWIIFKYTIVCNI